MIAAKSGLGAVTILMGSAVALLSASLDAMPGEPDISPGGFPQGLGVILIILGAILIWQSQKQTGKGPSLAEVWKQIRGGHSLPLSFLVIVYFTLFQYTPFLLSSTIFMALAMLVLGAKAGLKLLFVSLVTSGFLFLLFRYGFSVILP